MNWNSICTSLNEKGFAYISNVLSIKECCLLKNLCSDSDLYRSTINMQRYRFGKGEYKYFNYPLPPLIQTRRKVLRTFGYTGQSMDATTIN